MLICSQCKTVYGVSFGKRRGDCCHDESGWGGTAKQPCTGRLEQLVRAADLICYQHRTLSVREPALWGCFRLQVLCSHPAAAAVAPWVRGLYYAYADQLPRSSLLLTNGRPFLAWIDAPAAVASIARRYVTHQLDQALRDFYDRLPQIRQADRNWDAECAFQPHWTADPFAGSTTDGITK